MSAGKIGRSSVKPDYKMTGLHVIVMKNLPICSHKGRTHHDLITRSHCSCNRGLTNVTPGVNVSNYIAIPRSPLHTTIKANGTAHFIHSFKDSA